MSNRLDERRSCRVLGMVMVSSVLMMGTAGAGFDADGDQVDDANDAFPCESWAVASVFQPAQGDHGMLLFEDRWPEQGDLDFNDVALTYNYIYTLNDAGEVMALRATFNMLALGGEFSHGLGLHLPVPAGAIKKATRIKGTSASEFVHASSVDGDLTLVLSDNLRELFNYVEGPINSIPTLPRQVGEVLEIEIEFINPVALPITSAPYDVFIFRSGDSTHEIHRPEFAGTARMNAALFATADDGSTQTRHFVDNQGLPFALVFPTLVDYPLEGVEIAELYPNILAFASSGGTSNQDFYVTGAQAQYAYRDVNGNRFPLPRFIGPDYAPADTGCIVDWGLRVEWGSSRSIFTYGSAITASGDAIIAGYTEGAFPGETNRGGFDVFVGRYDVDTGLEIWVRQFGGTGSDTARDVALDAAGNIYVVGDVASSLNAQPYAGGDDVFVMKLDASGNLLWTRMFGGTGDETGYGVAVDSNGEVFIAGGSTSPSLPGAGHPGNTPASFLAKYDANGNRLWTSYYRTDVGGMSNYNYTLDISVDPLSNHVYAVGAERRYNRNGSASESQFVVKHNGANGTLMWTRHIGDYGYRTSTTDRRYAFAYGTAVDDFDGSVYVTGYWFAGSEVQTWGEWSRAAGDVTSDATLVKYSTTGIHQWSYTLGSVDRGYEFGEAVVADGVGGTVYFAGRTSGTLQGQTSSGNDDYYVSAYTYQGQPRWTMQGGTFAQDVGHIARAVMTSQFAGTVYVVGNSTGAFLSDEEAHWNVMFYQHNLEFGNVQQAVVANQLRWHTSPWGACGTSCGDSLKTRSVVCRFGDGSMAPDSACPGERPATERACSEFSGCNRQWVTGSWGGCSASCGSGAQARQVWCERSDGQLEPDVNCSFEPAPPSAQACNDQWGCTYSWSTGNWSECEAANTCQSGAQTRTVYCQSSNGAAVGDAFCGGTRPANAQVCTIPGCNNQSCRTLRDSGATASGIYPIDPDGPGGVVPMDAYCDMTTAGGGWTNLDFAANRIHLGTAGFIQCRGGLIQDTTSVTCTNPLFDDDATRFLFNFSCSGRDRTADYLKDHVGNIVGHNQSAALGFAQLSQSATSQWGPGQGNDEYCYINGQVTPWFTCSPYGDLGNGNCVVGVFRLGL